MAAATSGSGGEPSTEAAAETKVAPSGPAGAGAAASADSAGGPDGADSSAAKAAGTSAGSVSSDPAKVDEIFEALKDVVDPELGINIVDLGLVYDVVLGADDTAVLDMTLTSAACPLTDMIEDQVRGALVGLHPGEGLVEDFRINWVWMPPWDLTRITDDGRDQLRALGFAI
ncbi:metal-sulfur cluster assembly factor [Nakamurella aerolata]|uniref:metal-sulfur cluster assembly factor n=1 Tax=Nakamurella aerolata TaxID=1656892 RepID=UPI003CCD8A5F